MIEVLDLTKHYNGVPAVSAISFQVAEGETLGLIGTSGCGKTTTLKMLNRLVKPTSGHIAIGGKDIRQSPPEQLRQHIGYVIQNIGLFPHYTVADNIAVVPRLLRWKEKRISQRAVELLDMVGLPPEKFAQRYPHELSGGQQQRVGLARALAANPPVILLDEPFGALDQITRRQIQLEFKRLGSLLHKTMVLVTHDVFEAITLCDRICLMDQGKIQQMGTPKELVFTGQNDFVCDFFQTNRFQLELQVTRLQDLLPWLPHQDYKDGLGNVYQTHQSLLEVLEDAGNSAAGTSPIAIVAPDQKSRQITSCEDLLLAFYQYKKTFQGASGR